MKAAFARQDKAWHGRRIITLLLRGYNSDIAVLPAEAAAVMAKMMSVSILPFLS